MQFMMTAGITHEKGNRATNMVYTNMLFALLFDRWIFGTVPEGWSLVGSGLILGSAVYVAMQKGVEEGEVERHAQVGVIVPDEERGMLQDVDGIDDREEENARGVLLEEVEAAEGDDERGELPEDVQTAEGETHQGRLLEGIVDAETSEKPIRRDTRR